MLSRARERLQREEGVVLVIVMAMLVVLGLFGAAVLASAVSSKDQTQQDRWNKQAYGAALAGLRAAIYNVNTSVPDDNACPPYPGLTTAPTPNSQNICGPYENDNASAVSGASTQPVVNGRYAYWITPVLDSSVDVSGAPTSTNNDICTGAPPRIPAGRKLTVQDRCITVVGQATSVADSTRIVATRRIQARVSASQILFPIPGVWGTTCVTIGASVNTNDTGCEQPPTALSNSIYTGAIGSDGSNPPCGGCDGINLSLAGWNNDPAAGTTTPANMYIGCKDPACSGTATYDMKIKSNFSATATSPAPTGCTGQTPNGAVHYCTASTPQLPWSSSGNVPLFFGRYFPLPRVGQFFSEPPVIHFGMPAPSGAGCSGTTDVATCNDNSRITTAVTASGCGAGTSYTPATRTLIVGSGCTTLRIPDGTYDFCSLTLSKGSVVQPANQTGTAGSGTAEIRVMIDSQNRPGSPAPCPSGTDGKVNFDSSGTSPVWMSRNAPNSATSCNTWNLDPWTALAGQIYVYGAGDPDDPNTNFPVKINHAVAFPGNFIYHGTMEAPNSTFNVTGSNACVNGGLAAGALNITSNMSFTWDPTVDTLYGDLVRTFYRTAWITCNSKTDGWVRSDPSNLSLPLYPSDPMGGC
jgi:Tfp pilus assembly protein PilX